MKLQFHPGEIVQSLNGRDKDKYFVVLSCDERFVYLCDGKNRRLDNPKRKNVRHIISVSDAVAIPPVSDAGNKAIRKIISDFRSVNSDRKE